VKSLQVLQPNVKLDLVSRFVEHSVCMSSILRTAATGEVFSLQFEYGEEQHGKYTASQLNEAEHSKGTT